jgi:hypothetical protein
MNIRALDSSEVLVITNETTQSHSREGYNVNFHLRGNVKSHSAHLFAQ